MSNIDKSLAEVIAARAKNKRRGSRRGSAKASLVGTAASQKTVTTVRAQRTQAQNQTQKQTVPAPHANKIIVSNLPSDVNEAQIKELFSTQIGPTKEVTLHYDHAGRSKGVAAVTFSRRGDGSKAYQQYHNRLIDGKRPMKVEIVLDPAKAQPPPTLSERVGPAPTSAVETTTTKRTARAKRGIRSRGGKQKKTDRPLKSAEDLDAEMADYTGSATATAAAT